MECRLLVLRWYCRRIRYIIRCKITPFNTYENKIFLYLYFEYFYFNFYPLHDGNSAGKNSVFYVICKVDYANLRLACTATEESAPRNIGKTFCHTLEAIVLRIIKLYQVKSIHQNIILN